jgi:hypothetical protein
VTIVTESRAFDARHFEKADVVSECRVGETRTRLGTVNLGSGIASQH